MNLKEMRGKIDQIDLEMMELFKNRMKIARLIGQHKKENNLSIVDEKREIEVLNNKKQDFEDNDLWSFYELFVKKIMELSKAVQSEI